MSKAHGNVLRHGLRLCVLALLAGAAVAQAPPAMSSSAENPLEDWRKRTAEAQRLLEAGEYQQALDVADPLVREMKNSIWLTARMAPTLAKGVFLRAVAHAGLGHREEAAWDWSTARSLDPGVARNDLTLFGEAGQRLEEIRTPPKEAKSVKKYEDYSPNDIQRPRKIAGSAPSYPMSLKIACQDGTVVLESLLDEQGVPHNPGIVQSPHPAFSLAALEAVRGWRFEPARFKGEVVKVHYTLTVNFKVDGCKKQGP